MKRKKFCRRLNDKGILRDVQLTIKPGDDWSPRTQVSMFDGESCFDDVDFVLAQLNKSGVAYVGQWDRKSPPRDIGYHVQRREDGTLDMLAEMSRADGMSWVDDDAALYYYVLQKIAAADGRRVGTLKVRYRVVVGVLARVSAW